jgi:hypothetical protein
MKDANRIVGTNLKIMAGYILIPAIIFYFLPNDYGMFMLLPVLLIHSLFLFIQAFRFRVYRASYLLAASLILIIGFPGCFFAGLFSFKGI